MYLIPIGWLYVAVMMSLVEATSSNGTVMGAIMTLVLYGLLPVALMVYLLGAPGRKRAIRQREAAERASLQPDAGGHAAADAVAPVGKEP